jgi:superfamily II DNA/RNA helicase
MKTRDELAAAYFEQLPYPPYPVQENALLAWFTADQGLLVCAPTGTGKTLIAEAALFEALHTGRRAYYTTPLIALTEQKFSEMQAAAVRWGFHPDQIGLVTGNRRVNPEATVLVVVAEILLNRLLHGEAFNFDDVEAVVMDEFHSFADVERGIVWELALALLPSHVRTLLLSATVGNAVDFSLWLSRSHSRRLELVQSTERKVPLDFRWVGDQLLSEQLEIMAQGTEDARYTPALVFCFNREECWNVAEQLKGKRLLSEGQQERLVAVLDQHDWSQGAGPKLRQLLLRGVGVHHAGILPKYRRLVEELFQRKLLSICVCTETLSAGINLPARSVVLPSLLKGPRGDKKLVEASSAHQIFGRAGRPQFDSQGYVFALAHEDDVKIARWREKYDQIPEDTKDFGLLRMKKELKRKMPTRRSTEQYWNEQQFERLRIAPPSKLFSKGPLPWRLLAYMLSISPEVEPLRKFVGSRLMDAPRLEGGQKQLDRMLLVLHRTGYVKLEPEPPPEEENGKSGSDKTNPTAVAAESSPSKPTLTFGGGVQAKATPPATAARSKLEVQPIEPPPPSYKAVRAHPTPRLENLMRLRGINPLYGMFLVGELGAASPEERIQAFESVLEMPRSMLNHVRVPGHDRLPPGPLAQTKLDPLLLQLGLASPQELGAASPDGEEEDKDPRRVERDEFGERIRILTVADKLKLLFDHRFPGVPEVAITPCWAAGEVLSFEGNFNKYVTSGGLQKQEGIIFRHLLRMILLLAEFRELPPRDCDPFAWQDELDSIADRLTETCRRVDPSSTDKALEEARTAADGL